MAFSFRKMLSNITYFKKPGEDEFSIGSDPLDPNVRDLEQLEIVEAEEPAEIINIDQTEPDSTSVQGTSIHQPESTKSFASKKGSLSDTSLVTESLESNSGKRKMKNLKLDITKANNSVDDFSEPETANVENTPKHILLESKTADIFSEKFKKLDFGKSFDMCDATSDGQLSSVEDNIETDSLSDSDISLVSNEEDYDVKMCRKVGGNETESSESKVQSGTPESFVDIEIDKNEEDRINLLHNYQNKLDKMEGILKKLLSEFQFHIEVSKIFQCKSLVTTFPGTNVNDIPKLLGEMTYIDNIDRGVSPTGSWNIIMEKEDDQTKDKVTQRLLSMKSSIDEFVKNYLDTQEEAKRLSEDNRICVEEKKKQRQKKLRISRKKKQRRLDFPDLREAMINLFNMELERDDSSTSGDNTTNLLSDSDDSESSKCVCRCHMHSPTSSQTDSGLTSKSNDQSLYVTSSLGNFSLDTSTLTAYSESLDQIISYNSFQDTSLYSSLLQKAAIERITFYIQVHSIQLKCESMDQEYESKNIITFHCPSCETTDTEENGLLKHILSQCHCEKIHFLYKTSYIKKCIQSGKEIQPSTVLNPMKMYRDDNKVVCFGDGMYACSLCFENLIIGESILMAHCSEREHVERRDRLSEILE